MFRSTPVKKGGSTQSYFRVIQVFRGCCLNEPVAITQWWAIVVNVAASYPERQLRRVRLFLTSSKQGRLFHSFSREPAAISQCFQSNLTAMSYCVCLVKGAACRHVMFPSAVAVWLHCGWKFVLFPKLQNDHVDYKTSPEPTFGVFELSISDPRQTPTHWLQLSDVRGAAHYFLTRYRWGSESQKYF